MRLLGGIVAVLPFPLVLMMAEELKRGAQCTVGMVQLLNGHVATVLGNDGDDDDAARAIRLRCAVLPNMTKVILLLPPPRCGHNTPK